MLPPADALLATGPEEAADRDRPGWSRAPCSPGRPWPPAARPSGRPGAAVPAAGPRPTQPRIRLQSFSNGAAKEPYRGPLPPPGKRDPTPVPQSPRCPRTCRAPSGDTRPREAQRRRHTGSGARCPEATRRRFLAALGRREDPALCDPVIRARRLF